MEQTAGKHTRRLLMTLVMAVLLVLFPGRNQGSAFSDNPLRSDCGKPDVADTIKKISPAAEDRIKPYFDNAGMPYPSERLALIALKAEKKLEVWAKQGRRWALIRNYKILAASGSLGPKQYRGDCQVPEGIYRITALNPASRYHLSMKINYPNSYDLKRARDDGRENLGGDIFIHGRAASRGCIAVGNIAIEELFLLVAKTGRNRVSVIIAPNDLRKNGCEANLPSQPSWLPDLYKTIAQELAKFKVREEAQNVTLSGNM